VYEFIIYERIWRQLRDVNDYNTKYNKFNFLGVDHMSFHLSSDEFVALIFSSPIIYIYFIKPDARCSILILFLTPLIGFYYSITKFCVLMIFTVRWQLSSIIIKKSLPWPIIKHSYMEYIQICSSVFKCIIDRRVVYLEQRNSIGWLKNYKSVLLCPTQITVKREVSDAK